MRVGIYARVSTPEQSCESQLRDLRAFCLARNLVVVGEYVDVGESGAKDSRPQLNALLAETRKRKLDAILVWRFDRFAIDQAPTIGAGGVPVPRCSIHQLPGEY